MPVADYGMVHFIIASKLSKRVSMTKLSPNSAYYTSNTTHFKTFFLVILQLTNPVKACGLFERDCLEADDHLLQLNESLVRNIPLTKRSFKQAECCITHGLHADPATSKSPGPGHQGPQVALTQHMQQPSQDARAQEQRLPLPLVFS